MHDEVSLASLHPLPLNIAQHACVQGAAWDVVICCLLLLLPLLLLFRATQILPDVRYTDSELRSNLTLSPNSEWTSALTVVGDSTLELTLSQFWSSLGNSSLEVEVSFHGLTVHTVAGNIQMHITFAGTSGLIVSWL